MVAAVAPVPKKWTAAEVVVLAAADLTAGGRGEFSEWDLTVAAWTLDRPRFGLRGYAQSYPDHKRVMMEIMGAKATNPIQQKYLEKVRPNVYRLTPLGKSVATQLRVRDATGPTGPSSGRGMYEAVSGYIRRPEFLRWQDNPEEPREWNGAAAFLGLTGRDGIDPADRLDEVRDTVQAAINWCSTTETTFLTRVAGPGGPPIHVRDLASLLDFLTALGYRFPAQLGRRGGPKPRR